MTPAQEKALAALVHFHEGVSVKWASGHQLGHRPAVLGSLVRAGLARSATQEEAPHGRHGPLVRFKIYQATPAGLAALQEQAK